MLTLMDLQLVVRTHRRHGDRGQAPGTVQPAASGTGAVGQLHVRPRDRHLSGEVGRSQLRHHLL